LRYRSWCGKVRVVGLVVLMGCMGVVGFVGWGIFFTSKNIFELLGENKELKAAITNLTQENQIGYAKVVSQERREGKLYTRLMFVETDRSDPTVRVLEKQYEIEGDVVHFDSLIVTFGEQLVMDGKEKSMYLWRRVYGETMRPQEGYPIETVGAEPKRYADICAKLSLKDKNMFWEEIWKLSNDTNRLQAAGIKAIYGNVIYRKLKPGLIYVFKISNSGTLYPEIVPDL
jgi:hypothetical protein